MFISFFLVGLSYRTETCKCWRTLTKHILRDDDDQLMPIRATKGNFQTTQLWRP